MEKHVLGELTLLDDTYNANPESARASIRALAGLHGFRRRVLVLGDMLELGALAGELHHAVGVEAAHAGLDALVLVGELAAAAGAGALEAGMDAARVVCCADLAEARRRVPSLLRAGDVALVKGSRRCGLDQLVGALVGERAGAPAAAPVLRAEVAP
jgi:UDP-N-acetylmuramoyl-tripeptide--D-alanyl-D-alanine ligase